MTFHLALLGAALAVASGGAAQAGVERLPLTGNPAFEVTAPPGWTATRKDGNLLLGSPDQAGVVVLTLETNADLAKAPLSKIAAAALADAGSGPYTSHELAAIGSRPGEAFYSSINENGTALKLRLVLVKLDDVHVGSETVIRAPGKTLAQYQALDRFAASIHFVGLR